MNGQSKIFTKIIAALNAMGAQYKIILPDGTQVGGLELKQPDKPKRGRKLAYQYGALVKHYSPMVDVMSVGDSCKVPWGPFNGTKLTSAVSAHCIHKWGVGSTMVAQDKENKVTEVLRLA